MTHNENTEKDGDYVTVSIMGLTLQASCEYNLVSSLKGQTYGWGPVIIVHAKTTQSERGAPVIMVSELLKTNICNMWGLTDLINRARNGHFQMTQWTIKLI